MGTTKSRGSVEFAAYDQDVLPGLGVLEYVSERCRQLLPSPSEALMIVLRGPWDLVTRVIIKVTILIITYNPT